MALEQKKPIESSGSCLDESDILKVDWDSLDNGNTVKVIELE